MASPTILDLPTLLAPIPGDNPAGVDIREDSSPASVYYKIKDARGAARAAERGLEAADEAEAQNRPDPVTIWRVINEAAPKTLAEKSKDLEIAAWLIEALLRSNGFAGLRDGFKLAYGLVDAFWDNLYPMPDEDGILTRVGPLAGLNGEGAEGTLIQPIRRVPITQGNTAGPFATYHRDQAIKLGEITDPKKKEKMLARGAVTMEKFEAAIKETPPRFFATLIEDCEQSLAEFNKLAQLLDQKCGADSPPASNIRTALEQQLELIKFLTKNVVMPAAAPAAGEGNGADPGAAAAAGDGAAIVVQRPDQIVTRDDAFRLLGKVAEYFREREPHSPISYTLDDLIRRGQLSLPELLAELIPDAEPRKNFLVRAGIQPPAAEKK